MSNTKHTPGPWWIDKQDNIGPISQDWDQSFGMVIGVAQLLNGKAADASLIAAAPELLEAAEMAFCLLDNFVEDPRVDVEIKATMVELQKAIAKAEGRDQK